MAMPRLLSRFLYDSSAPKLASHVKSARLTESTLISLAHRFSQKNNHNKNIDIEVEAFDTIIPIPERANNKSKTIPKCQVPIYEKNKHQFVIHGIRSKQNEPKNEQQINEEEEPKKTSSSSSAPLVLLHGYANSGIFFYRNMVGLASSSLVSKVYSLDLLGFGLSSRPPFPHPPSPSDEDRNVEQAEEFFIQSLESFRKAEGIETMILAGHSLGGYIGVAYAERYPERVQQLLLLSPAGIPSSNWDPTLSKRLRQLPLTLRFLLRLGVGLWNTGTTPADIIRWMPQSNGQSLVSGYLANRLFSSSMMLTEQHERNALMEYSYANLMLPKSGDTCLNRLLRPIAFAKRPTMDRIPNLCIPSVHIIYGQRDWMDPRAGMEVYKRCRERRTQKQPPPPKVEVYEVRNAGHLLMLENWKGFNDAVIAAIAHDQHEDNVQCKNKMNSNEYQKLS